MSLYDRQLPNIMLLVSNTLIYRPEDSDKTDQRNDELVRGAHEPGRLQAAVLTASIVIAVLVSAAVGVLVFFLLIYGW